MDAMSSQKFTHVAWEGFEFILINSYETQIVL